MLPLHPAWTWPLQFCAASTVGTYLASIVNGNVSQVDRLWTFLPTIYSAYFALLPLWPRNKQPFPLCPYVPEEITAFSTEYSPRALLVSSLVVTWMFRLSYNTWRRGLFSLQDEDYRWAIVRSQLPTWLFQILNITFIAAIQNVLLMLLGVPAYIAAVHQSHTALAASDYGLALVTLITLAVEFVADNQQFSFQTYKQAYLGGKDEYDEAKQWPGSRLGWTPADAKRGFVTRGLWAWSRHPNFTCEQLFWWLNALFPVLAPGPPILPHYSLVDIYSLLRHSVTYLSRTPIWEIKPKGIYDVVAPLLCPFWPLAPAICLYLLFISSTLLTERITKGKYPLYAVYQRRVAMFGFFKTLEMSVYYRILGRDKLEEVDNLLWGTDSGKGKGKQE